MRATVCVLTPRRTVSDTSPDSAMQRNGTKKGEVSMFGRALGLALAILVFSFGVALAEPEDEGTYGRDGFHVMVSGAFLLDLG